VAINRIGEQLKSEKWTSWSETPVKAKEKDAQLIADKELVETWINQTRKDNNKKCQLDCTDQYNYVGGFWSGPI
jgi:hypothetical protein